MAVIETIIMERSSPSILWPFEAIMDQDIIPFDSISTETSTSNNQLRLITVRTWDNNVYVNAKSFTSNSSFSNQYFSYVVSNNIKITRSIDYI